MHLCIMPSFPNPVRVLQSPVLGLKQRHVADCALFRIILLALAVPLSVRSALRAFIWGFPKIGKPNTVPYIVGSLLS